MLEQYIGHIFDKSIKLNLLPHMNLKPGYYTIRVDWVSHGTSRTEFNHTEFNTGPSTDVIVGSDVYSMQFSYRCHDKFPTNPLININQNLRIDRLILLNFAVKLIRKS